MVAVNGYTAEHTAELLAAIHTKTFSRKTASYTLVLTDQNKVIEMNVAGANDLTVPPNVTVAFPIGTVIDIAQYGAGTTTLVPGSDVVLRSRAALLASAGQYARFKIEKVGTNEWYVSGDVA